MIPHYRYSDDGALSIVHTDGDAARTEIALKYIVQAYPGEPLFCIRGRDLLALPALQHYLSMVERNTDGPGTIEGPVAEAVRADIAALVAWQTAHDALLKLPDRPF